MWTYTDKGNFFIRFLFFIFFILVMSVLLLSIKDPDKHIPHDCNQYAVEKS